MSTSTTIFGRTTGFQASMGSSTVVSADAFASLSRNLASVLRDGWSSTSSLLTVQLSDGTRPRGLAAAIARPDEAPIRSVVSVASVLTQLQQQSGLTLEELADVLGTTRRTLHNWKNGGAVNAINERRLRDVGHAVEKIARAAGGPAREVLRAKCADGVRPVDLLAEGRMDAALALATGERRANVAVGEGLDAGLAARLDPVGPIVPVGGVQVLKRPSRRNRS